MMGDSLHAFIEHGVAELRGAYPRITSCLFALHGAPEGEHKRYSLWLDIRWPGHQSIVSGPACDSEHAAVRAGLEKARRLLDEAHA